MPDSETAFFLFGRGHSAEGVRGPQSTANRALESRKRWRTIGGRNGKKRKVPKRPINGRDAERRARDAFTVYRAIFHLFVLKVNILSLVIRFPPLQMEERESIKQSNKIREFLISSVAK